MLETIQTIILGMIEGVTEFLPISSTAHLIIGRYLLGINSSEFLNFFIIFIQLGAISAVPILYYKRLSQLRKSSKPSKERFISI